MTDLNQLLQRLCDAKIEFVVIGGFAAMLHGSPLLTRDLDVCAVITAETVEKLRAALGDLNPVHRFTPQKLSFMRIPAEGTVVKNLYLETELGLVDILSSVLGVGDLARLKEHAVQIEIFGRTCKIISLEDLITAKSAVGRDKDIQGVKLLRAIAEKEAQKSAGEDAGAES